MLSKSLALFCLLSSASILHVVPGWAWGDEGHKAVAIIAYAQLSESSKAAVNKILANDPVIAECSAGSFIEDSVWADKLRQNPGKCACKT